MALINCPECQQQISDKSKQCIHCGYPLEELEKEISNKLTGKNIITIYPRKYELGNVLELIMIGEENQASKNIRNIIGLGVRNSHELVDEIKRLGEIPREFSFEKTTDVIKYPEPKGNNPKCQYCNSANTYKITTTSKAINTALFGIFGTKRHKQFHCNNCGADF